MCCLLGLKAPLFWQVPGSKSGLEALQDSFCLRRVGEETGKLLFLATLIWEDWHVSMHTLPCLTTTWGEKQTCICGKMHEGRALGCPWGPHYLSSQVFHAWNNPTHSAGSRGALEALWRWGSPTPRQCWIEDLPSGSCIWTIMSSEMSLRPAHRALRDTCSSPKSELCEKWIEMPVGCP